jgi:hypothetical protein
MLNLTSKGELRLQEVDRTRYERDEREIRERREWSTFAFIRRSNSTSML